MKKLFSLASMVLTLLLLTPAPVHGDTLVFPDDSETHKSSTHIFGDINRDGELNVSDLVILKKYLHGQFYNIKDYRYSYDEDNYYYRRDNFGYFDINCDGEADIFDLVRMRDLVLNPEKAYKQIYSTDILASAEKSAKRSEIISSAEGIRSYLSDIGTSDEEIQKYLKIYDNEFFKDNNVVFGTLVQEHGNGIHLAPAGCGFFSGKILDFAEQERFREYFGIEPDTDKIYQLYFLLTCQEYEYPPIVYPEKTNILLFHTNVPKDIRESSDVLSSVIDCELFARNYSSHTFYSPDYKHRLYIAVSQDSITSNIFAYTFYFINDDGTYDILGTYYGMSGHDEFDSEYELTYDEYNFPVYKFSDSCSITWTIEYIILNFESYVKDEWKGYGYTLFNYHIAEWYTDVAGNDTIYHPYI